MKNTMPAEALHMVEIPAPIDLNEPPAEAPPAANAEPDGQISEPLLRQMLSSIERIDFRERLEMADGDAPKQKHVLVAVVEEVLNLARRLNYGLVKKYDFIYLFNGQFWRQIEKDELKSFLGMAAERMGYDWKEARTFEFRDKVLKQFFSDAMLSKPDGAADRVLINLKNGTFEVTADGQRLRDFDRRDFLTYQLPFEFEPSADCPKFQKFLDDVLPDAALQNVLAEFFGYVFTRHIKLEKCLLAHGTGANGKSVLFDIINAVFGRENVSNFSLANLKEEHNRALIANKLLNYGSEIRASIEADDLKLLISGEPIQARLKYGNSFCMDSYAKLAFNCNTLPKDVEHSEAYFLRFLIVPFEVTVDESRRNPDLAKQIIREEMSGIFNWILEGLARLLKNKGFTKSEKAAAAVQRFRQDSDSVFQFIDENNYKGSPDGKHGLGDVFREYRSFCGENGYKSLGKKNFSERLKLHGIGVERVNFGMAVRMMKAV